MEPRPLKQPQRPAPPAPHPAPAPQVDRGNWAPPGSTAGSAFSAPIIPPVPASAGPMRDPAAVRTAWYDPSAAAIPAAPQAMPPGPGTPGYSPGPALTPIDGGRGARILGPLLALVVLAAVVGAVVFVVMRVFDDNGGRNDNAIAASGTVTAIAAGAGAGTAEATQAAIAPTATASGGGSGAAAGAQTTAAPSGAPDGGATQAPGGTTAAPVEPSATPKPTAPTSARAMLPASGDLPAGFERTEDDKRTKDAVAASFSNTDEASGLLDEWGWRENAYRTFEVPASSSPDPNSTTLINVSVHRFSSSKNASSALSYFADDVRATQGLTEVEVEKVGDRMIALSGKSDGSNLVVLYVRSGSFLIRIGGFSATGDPTRDVVDLAKKIVG